MNASIDKAIESVLYAFLYEASKGLPVGECVAAAKKELLSIWSRGMEEADRDHRLLNAAKKSSENDPVFDPFPKWKWKMDWCKEHGLSPTLGWGEAEEAWAEDMERKIHIDRLSAEMNEFMTRRPTCNCCSDMEVDIHAAELFDFSLDDPPEGWKKDTDLPDFTVVGKRE